MMHGQNFAKAFVAFATLGLAAACADNGAVAPVSQAPAFTAPANFLTVGSTVVFRVNNAEGITKRIGNELISIPAGAICDLATSGYGTDSWDKACNPLKGSVVITATVLEDADGMPYVDFQPAMRFAPSKEVVLFLRQSTSTAGKELFVNYCNNVGYCYDESVTDASLKPFRIGNTPVMGRRVKHFSGYMLGSGGECTSGGEGNWCGGTTRRSGYMVASGEDVSDLLNDKDQDGDRKGGEKQD
jgi:hypothetical protein